MRREIELQSSKPLRLLLDGAGSLTAIVPPDRIGKVRNFTAQLKGRNKPNGGLRPQFFWGNIRPRSSNRLPTGPASPCLKRSMSSSGRRFPTSSGFPSAVNPNQQTTTQVLPPGKPWRARRIWLHEIRSPLCARRREVGVERLLDGRAGTGAAGAVDLEVDHGGLIATVHRLARGAGCQGRPCDGEAGRWRGAVT